MILLTGFLPEFNLIKVKDSKRRLSMDNNKYKNNYEVMTGSVYLLTDGECFKIGVTRGDVYKRITKLQTGNPYDIKLIDFYETNYPFKIEKMLHKRYGKNNVNNEWFFLEKNDVLSFKNNCKKCEEIIAALKDNPFFK